METMVSAQPGEFVEFEFASDTKQAVIHNCDIKIAEELHAKLKAFKDDDLVQVKKKISSPLEIIEIELVDDHFIDTHY